MANSSILLEFTGKPSLGSSFSIHDGLTSINMVEVFENVRYGQYTAEIDSNIDPRFTASNYADAFNLDHNLVGLYTVSVFGETVIITANNPLSQFSVAISNPDISTVIDNVAPPEEFTIDNVLIEEASSNPCDYVKLTVTTSEQADTLSSPVIRYPNTNPFSFETLRKDVIDIYVLKLQLNDSTQLSIPKLLTSFFNVQVLNTPSLASISINNSYTYVLNIALEYSIDGINWQTSKNFNSLPEGDYTAYVRDDIGCSIELPFTVDAFTPNVVDYDGICEVSNLNSIRYKTVEDWDINPRNIENTLSFEEKVRVRNDAFLQLFQTNDVARTQIKTNYSTIEAKIIDKYNTETVLDVVKRSSNMSVTDVRDGETSDYLYNGANYVAITFKNGKTYDPITLIENGDYNLGENLPEWMNADDYVNVQGAGWFKVLDIVYTNNANAIIINVLSNEFALAHGIKKVSSVYNIVDYERYEFDINFGVYEGFYKVQIDVSDETFGSKQYVSEWLSIKDEHKNTHLIKAYNSVFNEINFGTGYYTVLRIPYVENIKWKPNTENDLYVTDTNTVNLEYKYRSFWDMNLRPIPTAMAEKITMVLGQDRLFIDGVNYVLESEIESKQIGGQHQLKASLVKSNYVFDSNLGKGVSENTTYEGIPLAIDDDAPGLLFVED